jgi:hypothetical protein
MISKSSVHKLTRLSMRDVVIFIRTTSERRISGSGRRSNVASAIGEKVENMRGLPS